MFGYQHIVEVPDLMAKFQLVFDVRSYSQFDIKAFIQETGIQTGHFNDMLSQERFRLSTIIKFAMALDIPLGVFFWEWSDFKNYIGANDIINFRGDEIEVIK